MMQVTEEQAKELWCPMVRMGVARNVLLEGEPAFPPSNREVRNCDGDSAWIGRCIASQCMAWSPGHKTGTGSCGLARL
jgi:hypothetical protein